MAVPFSAAEEAQRPLQSIPYLLSSYDGSNAADVFASVASHFGARFAASPEQFMQVPVLTHSTAETIPANSLVRFRGMVVDMFNPEFFLGAFKENDSNTWLPAALYTDSLPPGIEASVSVAGSRSAIMERRPLLVAPVPHESAWATAAWAGRPVEPETPRASERAKRSRQLPSDGPAAAAAAAAAEAAADSERAGKGSSKAARLASSGGAAGAPLADLDAAPSRLQQQPDQQGGEAPGAAAAADEHQQQQPRYQPGDCIVQVYGDADGFRLHDVVEVLGVLSVTPAFAALHMQQHEQQQGRVAAGGEDDDDDPMAAADAADRAAAGGGGGAAGGMMDVDDDGWLQQERAAALPPTSQVMRLHALCIRKAAAYSSSSATGAIARAPSPSLAAQMPLLRQRALSLLAAPLGGDELAAEYVLLASLGSILTREAGGAPGMVPLNLLTHAPSSSSSSSSSAAQLVVPGLAAALRCLLPRVALLPLNLPSLNNARWYPQQAANTGRLFRGRLQLAEGTLLLLDETEMGAGELGDAGVKNLKALEQVLTQQQLPCGCQVYTQNLPVNQPAVVLSTGRSVLRDSLSVQLPLQPQAPGAEPGQPLADPWAGARVAGPEEVTAAAAGMPELAALREYYAAARGLDCRLDQEAAVQCVARFRALQRVDPGFGQPELEMAVTLSKLLCSSLGQEQFSMDSWERVMRMEAQRKQRLAAALAAAPAAAAAAQRA